MKNVKLYLPIFLVEMDEGNNDIVSLTRQIEQLQRGMPLNFFAHYTKFQHHKHLQAHVCQTSDNLP